LIEDCSYGFNQAIIELLGIKLADERLYELAQDVEAEIYMRDRETECCRMSFCCVLDPIKEVTDFRRSVEIV